MIELVINSDFGGFGLSENAIKRLFQLKGWKLVRRSNEGSSHAFYYKDSISDGNLFSEYDLERDDLELVQVVGELGIKANGPYSNLKIISIPNDVKYSIEEYDGREHVAELHRKWF